MEYLKIPEVEKILRAAYRKSRRDHLLLLLSFQKGLRANEVAAIQITDIVGGRLTVARSKHSLRTCQPLLSSDNIIFDEPRALDAWLAERDSPTPELFTSNKGGKMRADSVGKLAKAYMMSVDIHPDLAHHHSLRHAWASFLLRSGLDLAYVKEALGHASLSSTIIYTHVNQDEVAAKATQAMAKALSSKETP